MSMFIKETARTIWPADVLRNKSVKGVPCNAKRKHGAIAKPGLSPHKRLALTHALVTRMNMNQRTRVEIELEIKGINGKLNELIQDVCKKFRASDN